MSIPCLKVDRHSHSYHRLVRAGFRIKNPVIRHIKGDYYDAYIPFKCVCGKMENIVFEVRPYDYFPKEVDAAKMIENAGGISREHLEDDGYGPEEIRKIRQEYV